MIKTMCQCKTIDSPISNKEIRNRIEKIVSLLVMSIVLLLSPIIIAAQAVSGVTGVVTDSGGGVVPGVQVILFDTKTNREITTTTNDNGVYAFNNVQPGEGFRITFTRQGFQTIVLENVTLGIGRTETQNAALTAGQVSETVTVTSTTGDASLNTTDSSIGNVIGQRQLRDLPIQIRSSPAALIGLQPGAVGTNVGAGATGGTRVGSVTGSRADQGNITVDGIDANDQSTGQAFATVANAPIDSIQEFRAVTANPSAAEGRSSGGQIQLTTNSGTNEFHGNLREYYRGEQFAANSFFNNRAGGERPALQRHQYGGSLGGPLPFFNFGEGGPMFRSGKDRLFFFFDYEARRDDSENIITRTVPLQSFREGRIGYVNNNPGCNSSSRVDTQLNCISYLTPDQIRAIDPAGLGVNQAFLNFLNQRYPLPNDPTGGNGVNTGGFRFNAPVTRRDHTYTTRIDSNLSAKQKVFGRFTIARRDQTDNANFDAQQFPQDVGGHFIVDRSYSWVVGHNYVISPNFYNQLTVGLTASVLNFPNTTRESFPTEFTFGGGLSDPYLGLDEQYRTDKVPTIRDDATWTKGTHTIQFGGVYKPISAKSTNVNDLNFASIGGTTLSTGLRPANILTGSTAVNNAFDSIFGTILGRYSSVSTNFVYNAQGNALPPGSGKSVDWRYNEYELYAQDNWKIRNDLTLNLGVRWHLYPAPYEKSGIQSGSNINYQDLIETRQANALAGIAGPTAEPITQYDLIGKANNGRPIYETDWNNFAPRLGFAYHPSFKGGILGFLIGDRKTSIRGGASMVYDRVGGGISFFLDQSSYIFDNSKVTTFAPGLTGADALLQSPRFTSINILPIQNTAPVITRPFLPGVEGGFPVGLADTEYTYQVDQNFQVPINYQWSIGFQRELPGNFLLDMSYVGRAGRRIYAQADAAQVMDFKDPASGQFMLAAFNAVQDQLQSGVAPGSLTRQPWIENQINLAFGSNVCNANLNCTAFVANNLGYASLFETGGSADVVAGLFTQGLLRENVGISGQFAGNFYVTNLGRSDYNGLLVSLQKRFSKGFEFDINYTYSVSKDNTSAIVNSFVGGLLNDITNPNSGYGPSDFDIRHLFNANWIWDLPFGRGRAFGGNMPKWLDAVVGGWTISGVVGARSGIPVSLTSGSYSRTYLVSTQAVFIGDPSALRVRVHDDENTGFIQMFDDPEAAFNAFRFPKHGESGSRNVVRTAPFFNLDGAISKKFKMPWSENHRLTIRAEAYNLTNTNSFNNSSSLTLTTTTFGRITTSLSNPREIQFGIRYDF